MNRTNTSMTTMSGAIYSDLSPIEGALTKVVSDIPGGVQTVLSQLTPEAIASVSALLSHCVDDAKEYIQSLPGVTLETKALLSELCDNLCDNYDYCRRCH